MSLGVLRVDQRDVFFAIVQDVDLGRPQLKTVESPRVTSLTDPIALYFTQRRAMRSLLEKSVPKVRGYYEDEITRSLDRRLAIVSARTERTFLVLRGDALRLPGDSPDAGAIRTAISSRIAEGDAHGIVIGVQGDDLSQARLLVPQAEIQYPPDQNPPEEPTWAFLAEVPIASLAFRRVFEEIAATMSPRAKRRSS